MQGLPHRRIEEWKYTDLRTLMAEAEPLAELPTVTRNSGTRLDGGDFDDIDTRRIVFVDGMLCRSDPIWRPSSRD